MSSNVAIYMWTGEKPMTIQMHSPNMPIVKKYLSIEFSYAKSGTHFINKAKIIL